MAPEDQTTTKHDIVVMQTRQANYTNLRTRETASSTVAQVGTSQKGNVPLQ